MNLFKKEIIINFFIGGLMLSSITYLVKYVKPEIGALIWAAPIILIPSILLLWCNNVSNKKICNFIYIAIPYLALTVIWQISFIYIMKNKGYLNDKYGVIKVIIISMFIWTIFALLFYYSKIHNYLTLL
jgi:hypothetical protein